MHEKTARLRKLMSEGYSIVEIDSDEGHLDTTLRRGSDVILLRFSKSDAEDLLNLQSVQ